MARKTLGYVHLEWTCPRCGTRNLGKQGFCNGCGAPQPEDVEFEQAAQETLIEDEAEIARAKAGPDLHCPYCEARNPSTAKFCGACGAELGEAQAREHGRVVGAHRPPSQEEAAPVICPACGSSNPPTGNTCMQCGALLQADMPRQEARVSQHKPKDSTGRPKFLIPLGLGAGLLCIAAVVVFLILGGRTEDTVGEVQRVEWSRTILIQAMGPVEYEAWFDEIPAEGEISSCELAYRYDSDEPVANATEVCGTAYTEDTGSGYGEVVQDCVYQVYEDFCTYSIEEWQTVDSLTLSGNDLAPVWPEPTLSEGQRATQGDEQLTVYMQTADELFDYSVPDPTQFQQFTIGSRWTLSINTFGQIRSLEPAN